ncbi:hypothetical protein, partial [Salinarimonas soli]|uniref:hypothetical protein n=1 Tax=Salinarimonas soli TaxID=1638099 RepID=UPI001AED58D1
YVSHQLVVRKDLHQATKDELLDERRSMAARLASLQVMLSDLPWGDWHPVYKQICARYDAIKAEIARRS